MELIAKQDMLNGIKAGDRFEAPDAILVALGLADLASVDDQPRQQTGSARPVVRRRQQGALQP